MENRTLSLSEIIAILKRDLDAAWAKRDAVEVVQLILDQDTLRAEIWGLNQAVKELTKQLNQYIADTVREIGIQGQLLGTIADLEAEIEKLKAEREAATADKGRAWAAQDHAIDTIEGLEKQRDAYREALRELVVPPPTEWVNGRRLCRCCGCCAEHSDECEVGLALKLLEVKK